MVETAIFDGFVVVDVIVCWWFVVDMVVVDVDLILILISLSVCKICIYKDRLCLDCVYGIESSKSRQITML